MLTFEQFGAANHARCQDARGFNHPLDSWSLSDWMTATLGELGEAAKRHDRLMRQQVQAPAMETPDPGLSYVPIIYHGKQIIRIMKKVSRGKAGEGFDSMISLPYLAIQGNR